MDILNKFSNNEVTHVKNGKVEYLIFNALEKYSDKIKCAVTLRHGGVSEGDYKSLNLRMLSQDKKENVIHNLERVCDSLDLNVKHVYKARQDHTDNILLLTSNNKERYHFLKDNDERIDGYITSQKDITTIITTADCNAIVMYDPVLNIVANIHSGWRGTTKRICIRALEKMQAEFKTKIEDIIVCVSPSILKCCFSSEDENFKKIFTNIWKDEKEENYIYYEKENSKRFHIDLTYLIKKDLINKGVKESNIHFAGICTCHNDTDFYSYRSKTQKKEQDYGCMGTFVSLL